MAPRSPSEAHAPKSIWTLIRELFSTLTSKLPAPWLLAASRAHPVIHGAVPAGATRPPPAAGPVRRGRNRTGGSETMTHLRRGLMGVFVFIALPGASVWLYRARQVQAKADLPVTVK